MANKARFLVWVLGAVFAQTCANALGDEASDSAVRARYANVKAGTGTYAPARQAVEDWTLARSRATSDTNWKNWVTQRRYQVSGWMGNPHEDASYAAGWVQDYVDPATGAWLPWNPSTPMTAAVAANPKLKGGWIAYMRLYNIERMVDAAYLFKLQGDIRYRDWAAQQLDFYAQNYRKFPLQTWNGQAQLMTQALDESVVMLQLLDVVRLLRGSVDESRIANWQNNLFAPMIANQIASRKENNNATVWKSAAITIAGLEFNNAAWLASGRDGALGLNGALEQGISADDFWFEGSLSYQEYVVQAVTTALIAASVRNQLEPLKSVLWRTQNLMISPASVAFKPGVAPAINDTTANRPDPNRGQWAASWRVLPTWIGLADVAGSYSWDTLLDTPQAVTAPQALPEVASRAVPGLDAMQIVNKDWHAFMVYGQKARFHAHQEAMNLQLQYGSTWILQSPGTVGYGSPLHAGYFRLAPAHNVPLIDGDGQLPYPSEGQFGALSRDGSEAWASHPAYRKGVSVKRDISTVTGEFVDTVTLTRIPASEARLGVVFNTACTVNPAADARKPGSGTLPGGAFSYWKKTAVYAAAGSWSAVLACGAHSFQMTVSSPLVQRVFVGVVPDSVKPYARQGIYIEGNGEGGSFVTHFKVLN